MFPSGETLDWSQQPGVLGAITRLYHHIMGVNQVGTVPTQGMVNPQEYNPVAQVAQGAGMVAHPTQHKLDWLMQAAPLVAGAAGALPKGLGEVSAYFEGDLPGTKVWEHPDNPSVTVQHVPGDHYPYKVFHGGEHIGYAPTKEGAIDAAQSFHDDMMADSAWDLQHTQADMGVPDFNPKTWFPKAGNTTENVYNPNSYSGKAYQLLQSGNAHAAATLLNKVDKSGQLFNTVKAVFEHDYPKVLSTGHASDLGKKIMAQLADPTFEIKDYNLTPMAKTASRNPLSQGEPGFADSPGIHQIINAKDSTYHATNAGNAIKILKDGKIQPGYGEPLQQKGLGKGTDYQSGVSASRVPRIASKSTRSINFVIDPKAIKGKIMPIAETGYGKTRYPSTIELLSSQLNPKDYMQVQKSYNAMETAVPKIGSSNDWTKYNKLSDAHQALLKDMATKYGSAMNKQFEFEQRTQNTPVTMDSVKGIIVDKSALSPNERAMLPQIQQMAKQRGLPYKEVSNGREMHTYRAKMSKTPKGQPMYGAGPLVGAAAGAGALYQQMFGPNQSQEQQ